MSLAIPTLLAKHCATTAKRKAWLAELPSAIQNLQRRWSLSLGAPYEHAYVSCSWVAPAILADRTQAILKIGMPHMEGEQEIEGLGFWNGQATVRLFQWDQQVNAMLLERCDPGTPLLSIPETEQDVIVAAILKRVWLKPRGPTFRPLSALIGYWNEQTLKSSERSDAMLTSEGLRMLTAMASKPTDNVLLATDLHSGNVLRARRETWLMIDPKPFVGDRAYDLTQHLFNCEGRLQRNPHEVIRRVADLAEVDEQRVRMWLFGRAAAEPRNTWNNDWKLELARKLSL